MTCDPVVVGGRGGAAVVEKRPSAPSRDSHLGLTMSVLAGGLTLLPANYALRIPISLVGLDRTDWFVGPRCRADASGIGDEPLRCALAAVLSPGIRLRRPMLAPEQFGLTMGSNGFQSHDAPIAPRSGCEYSCFWYTTATTVRGVDRPKGVSVMAKGIGERRERTRKEGKCQMSRVSQFIGRRLPMLAGRALFLRVSGRTPDPGEIAWR